MKKTGIRYNENGTIKRQSRKLAEEKIHQFSEKKLCDLDVFISGGKTRNLMRRIVEKRVSQEYWRSHQNRYDGYDSYTCKHYVSNHIKNIFGSIPTSTIYM